jgi:pyruvate, orthophosphate dikinase
LLLLIFIFTFSYKSIFIQDVEFTVENGILYILQTRSAKRTAQAAIRIAVSMVKEGMISEREALLRIEPKQMDAFLHPMVDPNYRKYFFQ